MESETLMSQFLYSKCVSLERVRTPKGLRDVLEEVVSLAQQKFIAYGQVNVIVRQFDKFVQLELWRGSPDEF